MNTQYYAADSFFRADHTFDTDSVLPLTIACIGGSLTELGREWVAKIKAYFEEKFPKRPVTIYNAGVGGTGSTFGAARFDHDVLSKNPDIVIIEFAVNDMKAPKNASKMHMENMIRQCLQQEKIPCVIFAYTPEAVDKDSEVYARHLEQVIRKTEVADYYGIDCVNIYEYFYRTYEKQKAENPNAPQTYNDFMADIYRLRDDGTYDVHPISTGKGYAMYAEAFIEAFDERLSAMLTRLPQKEIYCKDDAEFATSSYAFVSHDSERITYEGDWTVYTDDQRYANEDPLAMIGAHRYVYPFMDHGVRRTYKSENASFSFKTTANELSLYYHGAKAGNTVTVYADGCAVGEIPTKTMYQQPFQSRRVSLENPDHKEITVLFSVNEPTEETYVLQFGYIVERFIKD